MGVDAGISLDHVILGFELDPPLSETLLPPEWSQRQQLTLELAAAVHHPPPQRATARSSRSASHKAGAPTATPSRSTSLQDLGYERIAIGGLVAQKTHEILAVLEAIGEIREPEVRLHLLGVTRTEEVASFQRYGVTSFDSTSPFRQAFKDDRDNFHGHDRTWIALRIPQVDANPKLQRRIRAGEIDGRARATA